MKRRKTEQPDTRIHLRRTGQETEQHRVRERPHNKKLPPVAVLAVALVFLFLASLVLIVPYRQWSFTPAFLFESVRSRIQQLYLFLLGGETPFGITVYQYLAVMLVGAALAACGAIFQGGFKNVLAGPSTMGVMSGGSLGCLLYLLFFTSAAYDPAPAQAGLWTVYQQQICTLLGCFAGVALVLSVAAIAGRGRVSPSAMILSGTVFSSLTSNLFMLVQYYMILSDPSDTRIHALRDLMLGSFNGIYSAGTLLLMAVPILICLGALLLLRGRLNLLSLEEDEALTMGVNVRALRYGVIAAGTVLTAVVVAFCGRIGFLGFMIPLVGRKLAGPDLRRLLPVSMLLGAIFLVLVFDAAYIAGLTDSLNLFTSSIGGLVMLVALLSRKEGKRNASV